MNRSLLSPRTSRCSRFPAVALLATGLMLLSFTAPAGTYKWVDDKGVTHYSDTLPAQENSRAQVILDRQGHVVREVDAAPTAAQLKEREEQRRRSLEVARRAEEAHRRDVTLINTYTTEREIVLARDRNLELVDARVRSAQERVRLLQVQRTELQRQLDVFKDSGPGKRGAAPPGQVVRDLEQKTTEQKQIEESILNLGKERIDVQERFDADRARFAALKRAQAQDGSRDN